MASTSACFGYLDPNGGQSQPSRSDSCKVYRQLELCHFSISFINQLIMRTSALLSLLPLLACSAPTLAAPPLLRLPTSATDLAAQALDSAQSWLHGAISGAKHKWTEVETGVQGGVITQMIVENDIECELIAP